MADPDHAPQLASGPLSASQLAVSHMQVPKSITDRAPQNYSAWDQTKGDVRFWAPSVRAAGDTLEEALARQAAVLDEELTAVRGGSGRA